MELDVDRVSLFEVDFRVVDFIPESNVEVLLVVSKRLPPNAIFVSHATFVSASANALDFTKRDGPGAVVIALDERRAEGNKATDEYGGSPKNHVHRSFPLTHELNLLLLVGLRGVRFQRATEDIGRSQRLLVLTRRENVADAKHRGKEAGITRGQILVATQTMMRPGCRSQIGRAHV